MHLSYLCFISLKDLTPIGLQTSELSVFDGETFSIGASFSSFLTPECLRGGTGLMVWVIASEMGRSLSRMLSCMDMMISCLETKTAKTAMILA